MRPINEVIIKNVIIKISGYSERYSVNFFNSIYFLWINFSFISGNYIFI